MIGGWLKFILKVAVFKLVEFCMQVHFVISYVEDETTGILIVQHTCTPSIEGYVNGGGGGGEKERERERETNPTRERERCMVANLQQIYGSIGVKRY